MERAIRDDEKTSERGQQPFDRPEESLVQFSAYAQPGCRLGSIETSIPRIGLGERAESAIFPLRSRSLSE